MNRKLVKQAGSAFTITLPIDWIRENGLKAGDEISIEKDCSNLIIKSSNRIVGEKATLNFGKIPKRLKYALINSAYAKGLDELEVLFEGDFFPGLGQNIGYVVVEQNFGRVLIKDVSGTSTDNLDEIFKRAFQMTLQHYDMALEHIKTKTILTTKQIYEFDHGINQFSLFLERAIVKQSYANKEIGKVMFAYSYALEQIGDEITRMWREFSENPIKLSSEILEVLEISRKSLQLAFEAHYHSGFKKMAELVDLKKKLRSKTRTAKSYSWVVFRATKILEQSTDLIQLASMLKMETKDNS